MQGERRLRTLQVIALAAFALLGAQLVRMQIFDAARYRAVAAQQLLRALPLAPPRGSITDRNGAVLASNRPAFAIVIVPGDLPTDASARRGVLLRVEQETGTSYAALDQAVTAGEHAVDPSVPVRVRANLDTNDAIAMRAALAGVPGVAVQASPVRVYQGGDLLPHVLGYIGPIQPDQVAALSRAGYPLDALVGQSGVEAQYESTLRGDPGTQLVATTPSGRALPQPGGVPATPGADVVLSIDARLQQAATDALRAGIIAGAPPSGLGADGKPALAAGAAVVLDVHSGEVLAMASLPSYDANIFSGAPSAAELGSVLTDPARPLLDRAYMEVHPPGSIFKTIVGLAALQEGVATTHTMITSTGAISVPSEYDPSVHYVFRDWAVNGLMDFYAGIARSSDVYFYYLSGGYGDFQGLGATRIAQYARAFGLGAPTGLDLPGEAAGLVPDPQWKQGTIGTPWLLGDTYTFGIGQGYLTTTPMQMAVAAAAIANGGEVLQPRIVQAVRAADGLHPTPRVVRGILPIDPQHLAEMRMAMLGAATGTGTAYTGRPDGITIGGKTGTAEFGTQLPDGSYDSHGWYMAFAPYDHPEIAVVVYLEQGVGETHAGPVAKQIFQAYFALKNAPLSPAAATP